MENSQNKILYLYVPQQKFENRDFLTKSNVKKKRKKKKKEKKRKEKKKNKKKKRTLQFATDILSNFFDIAEL